MHVKTKMPDEKADMWKPATGGQNGSRVRTSVVRGAMPIRQVTWEAWIRYMLNED